MRRADARLHSERDAARSDLAAAKSEQAELEGAVERHRREIQTLQDTLKAREVGLDKLKRGEEQRVQALHAALQQAESLKAELADEAAEHRATKERLLAEQSKLQDAADELHRRGNAAAVGQRALARAEHQLEAANAEIDSLKADSESARQEAKTALDAADERIKQKLSTADEVAKALEARHRDLEAELAKAHAATSKVRKDMQKLQADCDERAGISQAELHEANRTVQQLGDKLLKAKAESEEWRVRVGDETGAKEAAAEAQRLAELEVASAHAAADRALERVRLADARAAAAEERASRAAQEVDAARHDVDDARLLAQNEIDLTHQRELDAVELQQKERRARLAAEAKLQAAEEEAKKSHEAAKLLTDDLAAAQQASRDTAGRERELERKAAAAAAELEEAKAALQRQTTLAKDETERQSNRLTTTAAAKQQLEESLVHEQAEAARLRHKLEIVEANALQVQQELHREKAAHADTQKKVFDLRDDHDVLSAAQRKALADKEHELTSAAEELRNERAQRRSADDRIKTLAQDLHRAQADKDEAHLVATSLQEVVRRGEAVLREKEREFDRGRLSQEAALKDAEEEIAGVRGHLREANRRAERVAAEAEHLKAGADRLMEARVLDQRLQEAEEQAKLAREATRAANRQLEEVTRRADSASDSLARATREHETAQEQLDAAGDLAELVLASPGGSADAVKAQLGSRSDLGRVHHALGHIARKISTLRGDCASLRGELGAADQTAAGLRAREDEMAGETARYKAEARDLEQRLADEKRKHGETKVAGNEQARSAEARLEAERLAAEQAAEAHLKHAAQIEASAREIDRTLRNELQDALDHASQLEAKLRMLHADSTAAQVAWQKEKAQLESDVAALADKLAFHEREVAAEQERCGRRVDAAEARARAAAAALVEFDGRAAGQQAEADAAFAELERLRHRAERATAGEAAARAELAKAKAQAAAGLSDSDAAARREADAAEKLADSELRLASCMMKLHASEVAVESQRRAVQKLEDLLEYADAEVESLYSKGRLSGVAFNPSSMVRRPDRDQALAAISRRVRKIVAGLMDTQSPALLARALHTAAHGETGVEMLKLAGDWCQAADATAENTGGEIGPLLRRAARAAEAAVRDGATDDAISQGLLGVAAGLADELEALGGVAGTGGAAVGPGAERQALRAFEDEVALLAARPSFADGDFDAAVAACEGLPDRFRLNAGLRDLMRALQAAAASDLLPFTHAEGALSTLPAELLTSLALSPLFSDVEAAVELCDALSAAHPAAAADLARLRSHVVPLGDALLHQRPAAALSDACAADAAQFLQKIVAGVYSSSGGGRAAPVYKWSKDGKRRMQAGLDALEGRLSDGEREVCRVKDEAKSLKTDLERCRAVLKGLEREADLGEKEAVGRLIVHQSTAEEMKAELTKLTGRLATAGDELHDAFACQRAAEEAKWAAEARLKGSESELRRLTTTADRLQAEAEALRARLRESDDAAELHERRLNERDAAHQRRADALQRDLQLTRGKARSLEDAGAAALAEKKKVEIELSDALRRSEAVENRLRKVESSALDSQRRAEEAERALDIALTDAQRAAADAAEAAARQKLAEAEAGEARARAEAAEADLWAAENARDDARRHAEALDRECRQVDLDREQLGAALAAAEDRAAEAERLASERLLKQHTADELSAQVSRLSDRLLAAQRETQDLRDAARKVEKERWDIEGRLRTAEGDRQTLLKQADKTQQDLDALTAKARWGQDQADRAKRLDTEKSDALRRADGLARDVQEARSRQKLADVERAEIAEKLLSAEVDISELRRKGDMARHKVKTLEQEINDAHRRAHDADVRADACEQRLLEEETTALARYQRAEAELDELRAHVADGGGAREQLAASLQRVSQLQDGEAELLLRIQHLETDLSAAHRAAAGAEEIRARLLEVNRRIEESEESLQAAEEARRAMDAEMHDARDQCHAAEHKARDAKRRADLLERELDDARTRLRQAEADKGEMHERMLSAENTREDWRRKLNLSQHEARSLQTEVEDLQRQVKLTEKQADEAQSDAARFRAELLHLEAGADELRRSVAESATTRQQLAEANRRLERLADAEAGLGAARQKAEVDQSEIKRLLSAVDDLLSKQNETILRAERAEEKLAAQEDSRRRLETEAAASKEHSRDTDAKMRKAAHLAEAAQRDLNEARDRVKALDSEVQALDHRLLSAERAKEEAKRRAETAEKRGLSLEQALEDGQRERRATEQRADEAQAQADQLQVALHALEAEVAESRKVVLEAAGLRQEVADLSKRLANSESLSEEHRASAARLDAQLRQAEGDLADMQRHVAASNELRIKLGESRRKNDIAEGQLHGLEKARATAEHHLSSTHDAVAALEQQLADTNRRVAGLESELFAANDRCARAEGECAALQEALVGNETAREDLRSRGELSEAAAAQLSSVAAADAARAGAAERRAAAAEERLALAVEQLLGCNAKAEAAEARLLGVQAEGHDARAALAKVAETRQKLAGGEEREAALRREVARLHADLDGAVRAATAAQALEDELVGTTKRLAEFEARAALDEEARKKMALDSSFLKEDTLHADLRARTAEERIADLELLVDTLKADHAVTVHGLQFEVEGLADKLKAQSIETELASVLAAKHEANCAELASGVQLLQAELEQRPTDDRLISLAEQLKYVSEELSRVNEQRTLWEAEARSMQDELQQTDRAVATLVATAPQTALSTHLPGLSSYHTRDSSSPLALPSRPLAHWARAIAALDPLHAKELNTLKNEVRAAADLSTSESEKQALETCHERLGHVQRRMNRGDMPSTTMLETIGDALLSGPIVSGTESTRERELVEALDGAAVSLSRGTRAAGIPHWSQWEAEMASLGLAQGAHTLQAASRSQKLDAGLLQALAAGVRDGGWELLEAVDHLAHGRPMPRAPPYCREDPILASVHTKPEAASLAAEYAECTLALDPASAAAMAVLAGAKRVECGWGSPQALQAFFEKSASAANDVSVRTSLRSAAQRIGRCSQIAPVLAVLNGGAGDPAWVDGLIHCRDDQVASGVVELANSVGERLQALQRGNGGRLGWEMLAARVVLETAVVTPPHAPHNIFRSLRMMSMAPPAGARGAAVLQQLRDDARAASAQLYDAAEVQLALRKTGERLASLQRQTAEPWQLAAIAAGLASGLSPAAAGRDKSRLPRLFRDAQRTRTVPRLSLSEICSAVAAGGDASIPHTTALTRLHALHRRSETGGIVESWEVAAIHEALHGTTQAAAPAASPTPTLPFLPDAPPAPPSGPMRAAAEQSELRAGLRKLDAFLKSVDLLSGEALSYKAQCVNLQARLADAVADTFAHNAAEKEEAAVLQSQVRDLERQLLLSRDETEALRLRELAATGRENALKLAVVHTEGELTHIRSHAEMHQHDAVSLNASIHTLWNILSPLAGLPSALTPTPDDLAQLAMAIKAKVLAAVETEAHLKALARRYAGVLSSVRLDPSVNDLEAIIAVLTSVLDKLMADVEEAQQVITRQNELLRLTSHTVTASAYELADLTQEVSPRKVHESAGDMLSAHRTSSTALHPPLHRRSSNASAYYSYRRDRTL
ncbi:hypothetical protein DIPPA_10115 [Diplonema papillatum]|nr:hypothetical protein DIPPA_10115 [Diplonema papillatum]